MMRGVQLPVFNYIIVKILFYIFAALSVYFLLSVIKILAVDIDRLTKYGWGYFTGQAVLLVVFIVLTIFTFKKAYKPKE